MYKKILLLLFLSFWMTIAVYSEETFKDTAVTAITETSEISRIETPTDSGFDFSDTMGNYLSGGQADLNSFFDTFTNLLFKEAKENISLALKIIIIALCCSVMQVFTSDSLAHTTDISFYVCYMVIFIFCMNSLVYVSDVCLTAIESMQFFMQSSIPVLGSVLAGSGKNLSVSAICFSIASICGACSVLSGILLPLGKMCAVIGGISGLGVNLSNFASSIKKAVIWALGILMTIFGAFVSIQGFAASAADTVAMKTAKFTAGSFIPLVGGSVSDTLESVLACGTLVKNAAGAASVAAMIYICLSPILKIVTVIIAYRFSAIVISPFCDNRIVSSVNGFIDSLHIFLAFVISAALMFIICAGIVCRI